MPADGTLLLTREEVLSLLTLEECTAAVAEAFRLQGEGRVPKPGLLAAPVPEGGFHVKSALLDLDRRYFAAKLNANFPQNRRRFGLPTIQGVVALFDGTTGYPLALMDSISITTLRTGAATAVAARLLARADARLATVCGCGTQGRVQLEAIRLVRPIEQAFAFDVEEDRARRFAEAASAELGLTITPVDDLAAALRRSDLVVTCTSSRHALVGPGDLAPGTFVAAVGADSPEKQELDPELFRSARVVVDSLEQCAVIGDLHHALEQRVILSTDVDAELGELVAGTKVIEPSRDDIRIFDSTGVALEDVAAAAAVYVKAVRAGVGRPVRFES